jgi:hypothetical protein
VRDTKAPKVSLAAGMTTIRAVLARGLRVSVGCDEPCRVQVQASFGGTRVGAARGTLARAGRAALVLKLSASGKARLAKATRAVLVLAATAIDQAGNRGAARRTVRLSRG